MAREKAITASGLTAAVASLVLGLGASFAVLGISSVAGGLGALAVSSLGGRGPGPGVGPPRSGATRRDRADRLAARS